MKKPSIGQILSVAAALLALASGAVNEKIVEQKVTDEIARKLGGG